MLFKLYCTILGTLLQLEAIFYSKCQKALRLGEASGTGQRAAEFSALPRDHMISGGRLGPKKGQERDKRGREGIIPTTNFSIGYWNCSFRHA